MSTDIEETLTQQFVLLLTNTKPEEMKPWSSPTSQHRFASGIPEEQAAEEAGHATREPGGQLPVTSPDHTVAFRSSLVFQAGGEASTLQHAVFPRQIMSHVQLKAPLSSSTFLFTHVLPHHIF